MFKNKTFLLIFLLFLAIFTFRLILIKRGEFTFSWDFARDLLWLRQLTIQHKPILVGPWGSLDNTFFGPLYYYLIAIPIIISNGNPQAVVALITLATSLLVLTFYYLGKKAIDKKTGIIFALFFALLPVFNQISLYAFSQNLIPFLYFLYLSLQWRLIKKPSHKNIILLNVFSALFFHFEPVDFPLCLTITISIILYLLIKKRLKNPFLTLLLTLVSLTVPFIPNIIFDLRHNFTQAHGFIRFFSGENISLHGVLPLKLRVLDRLHQFSYMFSYTFFYSSSNLDKFFLVLLIITIFKNFKKILIYLKQSAKSLFLKLILINLVICFIYFIIFPPLLKNYYLYMLPILYILVLGTTMSLLINERLISNNGLVPFLIITLLIINFSRKELITERLISVSGQTYFAQKNIVDYIYKLAQNRPFYVYVYSSGIYDYPYQYLFSWYGYQTYNYIPVEYSYLPNQPEYVLNKKYFDEKKSTNQNGKIPADTFLILEEGDQISYRKDDWLSKFPQENIVLETQLFDGLRLIHLKNS